MKAKVELRETLGSEEIRWFAMPAPSNSFMVMASGSRSRPVKSLGNGISGQSHMFEHSLGFAHITVQYQHSVFVYLPDVIGARVTLL